MMYPFESETTAAVSNAFYRYAATILGCSFLFCETDHSGQGEVFRAIGEYFRKEKERNDRLYAVRRIKGYKTIRFNRRTVRSLIEPVKNKGWKGKRC